MASALYSSLKQRAGNLLRKWPLEQQLRQSPYIDGEIVYSKNNVCVHSEGQVATETVHHQGYLCIEYSKGDFLLKWTPNRRLKKQASADAKPEAKSDAQSPTLSTGSSSSSDGTSSWATASSGADEHRRPSVFHCNLMAVRRVLLSAEAGSGDRSDGSIVEDCGHAVIQSSEWQLKLLHFHRGGLRRLAQLLDSRLDAFRPARRRPCYVAYSTAPASTSPPPAAPTPAFDALADFGPALAGAEAEAEAGGPALTLTMFQRDFADADGCVEDLTGLRRAVFLGGVEPAARQRVWPLLIGLYPAGASDGQRRLLRGQLESRLAGIRERRLAAAPDEFARRVEAAVDRDVSRADRDQAFYSDGDSGGEQRLRELLLDFAFDNRDLGYVQAMTELLSPLLMVLNSDAEAYYCFERLVRAGHFFSAPTDAGMDSQLNQLRHLLLLMRPGYYEYCRSIGDPDLLYCHRWMILCFKREFPLEETLRLWECCWAHCVTDYFHLFLCLAVIDAYGDYCAEKRLPADEALMYFSQLAGRMEAAPLLRRARRLLARFRALPALPCALAGLCHRCGPGMWDSGHLPIVRCPDRPHSCSYLR
ncbi:hypothetical protein BOX15_Mlig019128g1 [Macrostomum lignano]|uniref:Rab-GAP TBC domain-containing protein n=2 Tax=Macrostomum lignano TaxID=282301 RepID=A0A1I8GFZ5_9PLAT|nr:hypothetical protein BOX15_Mlig019128g1 [Macrostomum lignano]